MMKKIDLEIFRTPGSKVFTGRDRGVSVREASGIDKMVENDEVEILIPDDIRSINPSFLEEFLVNVVSKLKESGFEKKVKFLNNGRYKIQEDLAEAIDRILREDNALA